ncbi:hypothetical protein OE88DRAFT_1679291 [Heliocybe sulcata]|uniref:BTB domain-containing protein n=1 Tax=Heliocybe sulcata TaxID=5364 RepID=A0A5C3N3M1_9AGAM|nr:hypothetical protein OE88DRAFT_1679291 [Heliocybe sulcata]
MKLEASNHEIPLVRRHEEYYFVDGNVILLAEDVLFNLHRSLLERYSPVFRDMWAMPGSSDSLAELEGASDANPIVIHTSAYDFERFLWIFYPAQWGIYRPSSEAEWRSVLDQGEKWQVSGIKYLAGRKLLGLPLNPVEKVRLWRIYDLTEGRHWLFETYIDLARRDKKFEAKEIEDIGVETFAAIAKARELLLERHSSYRTNRATYRSYVVLKEVFPGLEEPVFKY